MCKFIVYLADHKLVLHHLTQKIGTRTQRIFCEILHNEQKILGLAQDTNSCTCIPLDVLLDSLCCMAPKILCVIPTQGIYAVPRPTCKPVSCVDNSSPSSAISKPKPCSVLTVQVEHDRSLDNHVCSTVATPTQLYNEMVHGPSAHLVKRMAGGVLGCVYM